RSPSTRRVARAERSDLYSNFPDTDSRLHLADVHASGQSVRLTRAVVRARFRDPDHAAQHVRGTNFEHETASSVIRTRSCVPRSAGTATADAGAPRLHDRRVDLIRRLFCTPLIASLRQAKRIVGKDGA